MYDLVFLAHARLNYSQFTEEMDFYAYLIPESANKDGAYYDASQNKLTF